MYLLYFRYDDEARSGNGGGRSRTRRKGVRSPPIRRCEVMTRRGRVGREE